MMEARAEAAEIAERVNIDLTKDNLNYKGARETLEAAAKLETRERELVVVELATRLWHKYLILAHHTPYPEFEGFLWEYFSKKSGLEDYLQKSMNTYKVGDEATGTYAEFLRGMFLASGKTRVEFYKDILAKAGLSMELDEATFGEKALAFKDKLFGTLHREHLLVFYSTGLLLKALRANYGSHVFMTTLEYEEVYRYFEGNLPLATKFRSYAKDDDFLSSGIRNDHLKAL